MIVQVKVKNFKALQKTPWISLSPFHVLVGPNGSGKSTFLDIFEFVRTCLSEGPTVAVEERAPDFRDITFMRRGGPVEIDLRVRFEADDRSGANSLHYRFAVTFDHKNGVRITEETLTRLPTTKSESEVKLLGKRSSGNDFFRRESGSYQDIFSFGQDRLALSLTPADWSRYPTANRLKAFLMEAISYIRLNSAAMRQPTPATRPTELQLDGTNLPRVVGSLKRTRGKSGQSRTTHRYDPVTRWTNHLKYALDDLKSITWETRRSDNAEYLVLGFEGGLECPSWLLSDGTLRMLALTLPAFLPGPAKMYMVEEPENGMHPHALEVVLQALSAIPGSQVFIATHSPMVVQSVGVKPLLIFHKTQSGAVAITPGPLHAHLKDWTGTPELASIFSSRVLG